MIVAYDINETRVITQTHHAHIAGFIGNHLKSEYKSLFFSEVIAAIFYHETQETDFNYTRQLNDLGQPVSFDKPEITLEEQAEKTNKILDKLKTRSLLGAALVSTHLKFLSPQVFTTGLVSKSNSNLDRKAMRLYKIKKADYDYLYGIVRFCDRLSLMICQNELPDAQRSFEINNALGNKIHQLKDKNGRLIIDPWPFVGTELTIQYEYHKLKQRSFKNSETFYKAVDESRIGLEKITFSKT